MRIPDWTPERKPQPQDLVLYKPLKIFAARKIFRVNPVNGSASILCIVTHSPLLTRFKSLTTRTV